MVEDDFLLTAVTKIGQDAQTLVKELVNRGRATEDELARATGIKLNEIRKTLYKLHNFSLAFTDTVQDKKTGWMMFYWRVQPDQIEGVIRTQKKRILEKFKDRLEYEKAHDFYWCFNDDCARLAFEEAMESIFKCPKCGKALNHFDNSEVLESVSAKVESLRKELTDE